MTETKFKDYFSAGAAQYAEFGPKYPAALFDFVAARPERRGTVWDCATGNGQAAVPLAERFERVIATDASAEQIAHATPHERVEYGVGLADASGLAAGSVDMVTVAQVLHWFPIDRFFAEVRRVVAPGGALAVWCYTRPVLADDLDTALLDFYKGTCGPHWSPERSLVDEGYVGIDFPIDEVSAPPLYIEAHQTLEEFGGYLRTWSAVKKLAAAKGRDPVVDVEDNFRPAWSEGDDGRRLVRWPIVVHAGRVVG